jgi:hypothetical protein
MTKALDSEFQGKNWKPSTLVKSTESILLLSMITDLFFQVQTLDFQNHPRLGTVTRLLQRMNFIYERAKKTRLIDHAEFLIRVGEIIRFSRYLIELNHLGSTDRIPQESPL